jgi:WhiB family redox-sensing transcriptional regulator
MNDENLSEFEEDHWTNEANCKGRGSAMFPKRHKDITYISEARRICRACNVKSECLLYALSFPAADMHGVWAGLTPRQLAKEQKTRGIKPTKPTIAEFMADMLRYYKEDPQFRDDPPQPLEDYNFDD